MHPPSPPHPPTTSLSPLPNVVPERQFIVPSVIVIAVIARRAHSAAGLLLGVTLMRRQEVSGE